jgi:hypothetical protein
MWWHLSGNIMHTSGPRTLSQPAETHLLLILVAGRGSIAGRGLALLLVHFTLWCVRTTATFWAVTCVLQHTLGVRCATGRGLFVTEHVGTLFRKFFLRMTRAGMAFQNLSFLPSIQLTPQRLRPHFGSLCVSEPIFFRKITRAIGVFEVSLRNSKAVSDKCAQNYVKRQWANTVCRCPIFRRTDM